MTSVWFFEVEARDLGEENYIRKWINLAHVVSFRACDGGYNTYVIYANDGHEVIKMKAEKFAELIWKGRVAEE